LGLEESAPKKMFVSKKIVLTKDQIYGATSQLSQYKFNFQGRRTLFSLPPLLDLTQDPEKGFGRYATQ